MDTLPKDMAGTTIGFGDKVAFAVSTPHGPVYSALRVGRVYGFQHDALKPPQLQVLVQVEIDLAETTVTKFGTRRLDKLLVIEKAKDV
jgi:hypothetical protein